MACLFCKIATSSDGEGTKLIYEDDQVIAFHDISPKASLHILVIPRRHISTINDSTSNDETLLGHMVFIATQLAKENNIAENGYRLILNCNRGGGQMVFHIHLHLLSSH